MATFIDPRILFGDESSWPAVRVGQRSWKDLEEFLFGELLSLERELTEINDRRVGLGLDVALSGDGEERGEGGVARSQFAAGYHVAAEAATP